MNSVYQLEEYLPSSLRDWVRQKLVDLRATLVENGILAATDTDTTESKAVQDARARLNSVTSERDSRVNEINSSEADLKKDYGPDEIFRALKGKCVDAESGEYIYELCFMDRTMQKPRNGGMDTNMGNFDSIEIVTVDEEDAIDGKGLGSGERIALKFTNGAHCWNGPARSTTVIFVCSEKNEIWKVIEEEKCVYKMEGGSPAGCFPDSPTGKAEASKEKDEL
jgi:protein kinase C substrate 80K-H